MEKNIPVFTISSIEPNAPSKDLLIDRFGPYLEKHYSSLHSPHKHYFYHLVLFTSGAGWHSIDFEKFPVKPDQIYFMIPGQVHSWHFEEDVDGYIIHFNEELFSTFLQNTQCIQKFSFFSGVANLGVCQIPSMWIEKITSVFEELLEIKWLDNSLNLDLIRIRLLEIFILIEANCPARKIRNQAPQKLMLFRSFQSLVDQHYRTLKLPKEYAELLSITPNHLNALSQDRVGKTAGDLIRGRLLVEAKRLLTNADMSILEVAYDLNFQDNSYFNGFFKKHVGVTPDSFRKKFINHEPEDSKCAV
ncbi:MAG TPA: helix-turn-helix transcriptional regulator [Segetibacter sp.]|jgi:AraC-like DNA-binding protein